MNKADEATPKKLYQAALGMEWYSIADYNAMKAERDAYRTALIMHRADIHQYSSRPCPTCKHSAEFLGIADKVPNTCALNRHDAPALATPNVVK